MLYCPMIKLIDAQKPLVENRNALTAAESRYAELKAAAETPADPADPEQPAGGDPCPWDNVDHGASFFGRIVRFFHTIFFFFARLFGLR